MAPEEARRVITRVALVVHDAVGEEHQSTVEWYAARDPAVARRFVEAIQNAFDRICENPRSFPLVAGALGRDEVRRIVLRGFPFVIPYVVQEEAVFVLALAHTRRSPGYWKVRVPQP